MADESPIDALDARIIRALTESPRLGVVELSRRLGVARGTAQARLDRLIRRGTISGFGPDVSPSALGYGVTAFATLETAQGRLADVVEHLRAIPEVLEVHVITGQADLHCRIVARSNEHLHEVTDRILEVRGIDRVHTVISLSEQIRYRTLPLIALIEVEQDDSRRSQ